MKKGQESWIRHNLFSMLLVRSDESIGYLEG